MRMNEKKVLRDAEKLHSGEPWCCNFNLKKWTVHINYNERQTSTVVALSCESDHIFMAPVAALYRSVSQRYSMGRAKAGGSVGLQPAC